MTDTQYRLFLDHMIQHIKELTEDVFDPKGDPEKQWKFYMDQLRAYKREQILKWLELDDDETIGNKIYKQ